jgi:hypothetical protein
MDHPPVGHRIERHCRLCGCPDWLPHPQDDRWERCLRCGDLVRWNDEQKALEWEEQSG